MKLKFIFLFLIFCSFLDANQTDIILFSFDRPLQAHAFLESTQKLITGLNKIHMIYRTSTSEYEEAYEQLKRDFSTVNYLKQGNNPSNDFKTLTLEAFNFPSKYVAFAVDDIIITDHIDLHECTEQLNRVGAFGFYLRMGKNITKDYTLPIQCFPPTLTPESSTIVSWKFSEAEAGSWAEPCSVDMTVYKKDSLRHMVEQFDYTNPNNFECMCINNFDKSDKNLRGLCFEKSRIINIPLNIVQDLKWHRNMGLMTAEELLDEYNMGMSIDIDEFYKTEPEAPHTPLLPSLVSKKEKSKADLIIFSYDRPMQCCACIESAKKYFSSLNSIQVIYRTSHKSFNEGYKELKSNHPDVVFIKQGIDPHKDFQPLLLKATFENPSPSTVSADYVVFAVDDIIVTNDVDIDYCIKMIEKEDAYGFYLRLGKNITMCYSLGGDDPVAVPRLKQVEDKVYSWFFDDPNNGDWSVVNTVDLTIYPKKKIEEFMRNTSYATPNRFETYWIAQTQKGVKGLCFESSKMVNIPLNIVQEAYKDRNMNLFSTEELLEEFLMGSRINVDQFRGVVPVAPHMPYIPEFI